MRWSSRERKAFWPTQRVESWRRFVRCPLLRLSQCPLLIQSRRGDILLLEPELNTGRCTVVEHFATVVDV